MQDSTSSLRPSDAVKLLRQVGCDSKLISHMKAVSHLAVSIAEKIKSKGHQVDVEFVEVAALLHDIGRSKTQDIRHGVEGAAILRSLNLDSYARICETHIGAGLTREEAKELGLPPKDYLPQTLEEKIIAHADNLIEGSKEVSIDETIKKVGDKLGPNHPAVRRIAELNRFIVSLSQ